MTFQRHTARKRFGQHWLRDPQVLGNILLAADLRSVDRVLEIGPGKGALTEKLLDSSASSVHAVEIDRDLVDFLRRRFVNQSRFTLVQGDVLKVPLTFPDGALATKVVANIPYNITGPLLEKLLGSLSSPVAKPYELLILLLQKEVANRITANPGDKSFSSLSVRLQLMAYCRKVCSVPPRCFVPPPKVHSEVIAIEPFNSEKYLEPGLARRIEILLRKAFLSRRKMLRNTLKDICPLEELELIAQDVGVDLQQRPQEIPPLKWLEFAKALNSLESFHME
ncbi:16S rRNA (adenine(1518)-N(6)/adenine(1519)-N(6))-dimethyltransferase RsmA [Prochlorococcus sp. MIT 1341]|uniref:16S rRNA (adenine(1518)-N(6)/adenine(1519)-N(6))- dimethyltransferase RsmA n=1 Tax=Prochlorococcus sp. MIT 1341 TaxID=3096221 RepID=UPI002A7541C8|nr:16S rRNA (adenine(1518)-N(6)/adenine(1519)-N(6))-dimethyltransferase RsmA [Prochlorococcus sp. MIT 1341]